MEKTYISYKDVAKRNQIEYTSPTKLLDKKGNLLVMGGYGKHNVFEYNRNDIRPKWRGKEWDFYQICNGKYMVQISFANISIGGYASAVLVDISGNEKKVISSMDLFLGKRNKYVLPSNGDTINRFEYKHKNYYFLEDSSKNSREVIFYGEVNKKKIEAKFQMDLFDNHENITIVTPFKNKKGEYRKNCFFMTMKQNCMPTEGYFKYGEEEFKFSKDDTFTVLDWGRGVWPYKSVWYWGNGSSYIYDSNGNKHIFGFEVTWGIGDESNATETCLFLDGKAYKFGSCDVDVFPKPDKYMEPWHIVSEDGKFDLTMTPKYDHYSDLNLKILRMESHQVHGIWNGVVRLDDNTELKIENMYSFCEYVENRW